MKPSGGRVRRKEHERYPSQVVRQLYFLVSRLCFSVPNFIIIEEDPEGRYFLIVDIEDYH